jgi:6-pyruvoyltetrahydropterin/6-carboxytetrahydropterin synthase
VETTKLAPGTPEFEYYESFFIVDFIPTSENLSKWVFDLVEPKMARIGVKVGEVEWWETPKSCSRYGR